MTIQLSMYQAGISPDAMVDVDDEIAGPKIRIDRFRSLRHLLLSNA